MLQWPDPEFTQNAKSARWDATSEDWDQQSLVIQRWLGDATAAMLQRADVRSGMSVLDVAAGTGGQSLDILRRIGADGRIVLTDVSARMLAIATRNLQAAGYGRVPTLVADCQRLELEFRNFDAAVCRLGLMLLVDPLRALENVHCSLRPGGRFSALVFAEAGSNPCVASVVSIATRRAGIDPNALDGPGSLMSLGTPERLKELFEAAGFVDIEIDRIMAPFESESTDEYLGFLKAVAWPITESLKGIDDFSREDVWTDIKSAAAGFKSAKGWEAPIALLLVSGAR